MRNRFWRPFTEFIMMMMLNGCHLVNSKIYITLRNKKGEKNTEKKKERAEEEERAEVTDQDLSLEAKEREAEVDLIATVMTT
jgi:hypothetical protein